MKYDPLDNRVWRQYHDNSGPTTTTRKYVVDIAGRLPTILCEINTDTSSLTKSYIYSDTGQILCQRDGGQSADEYFYVTDRLGSVRQVVGIVDQEPAVVLSYTYSPFGQMLEQGKKTGFEYSFNSFLFTGQWFDSEFGQYYLRARMYDPVLGRFTSRDLVRGKFQNPMTLHPYLYCLNDPINRIDPSGESPLIDLIASVSIGLLRDAKDASASAFAEIWATKKLETVLTTAHATFSGYYNMLFGPESMSDTQKFIIGFMGGAIEMQLGLHVNARVGMTSSALFVNTANNALCYRNTGELDSFWGFKAAVDIGFGALFGSLGDSAADTLGPVTMYFLGLESQVVKGEVMWGLEWLGSL